MRIAAQGALVGGWLAVARAVHSACCVSVHTFYAQRGLAPSVTVVRNHADDVWDCQMIVWIDGQLIARLTAGFEVERQVDVGPHRLRIRNTLFWKSVTFDARPGDRIRFQAVNRSIWLSNGWLDIIGISLVHLTVRRVA